MRRFIITIMFSLILLVGCDRNDEIANEDEKHLKFINNGLPIHWKHEDVERSDYIDLTVTSEKTTFKLGEPIRLLVLFKCKYRFGKDIEVVYSPTFKEAFFDFDIKSEDGKKVYQKGYDYFRCEYPNNIKIYQELFGKQYWGLYTTVSMYYQFNKTGVYTIQLKHKYVSNFLHFDYPTENKYTVIESNVHKIRVVDKDDEVTEELKNESIGLDNFPLELDSEIVNGLKMNIYNSKEQYADKETIYIKALVRNTTDRIIDLHKAQHGYSNNMGFDEISDHGVGSLGVMVSGSPNGTFCYRLYPNTLWGCEINTVVMNFDKLTEPKVVDHKYRLKYGYDKYETILVNLWNGYMTSNEIILNVKYMPRPKKK